jgi:predicted RNA-binding Zn ribbon-like protein
MASRSPSAAPRPGSRAGRLPQIAGVLALDFCNTSSGRGGPQHQEHLQCADDVLAWAAQAALVTATELRKAAQSLGSSDAAALLRESLTLRESVHAVAGALASSRQPEPSALDSLLAVQARCLTAARLEQDQRGYRLGWDRGRDLLPALLGPIAQSAVKLLLDSDLGRIKRCGGQDCGWLFFDQTKNRRRRWCEMSVCGNRAKQRRLRRRQTGEART